MKIILTVLISSFLGAIFEKYNFCMTSIFSDFLAFGDTKKIKGLLITLLISTILFNLLIGLGVIKNSPLRLLPTTIFAGMAFGIGMIFAGGCVAGTLFKLSRGYIALLIAFIGIILGFGALGIATSTLAGKELTINHAMNIVLITGADHTLFAFFAIAIGIISFYVYKKRRTKRKNEQEWRPAFISNKLRINWSDFMAGAALIAILNAIFFVILDRPLSLTGFMGYIAASFANLINPLWVQKNTMFDQVLKNAGIVVQVFPFIIGAFLSSYIGGRFGIRLPSLRQAVFSLTGGFLMGLSAPLMMGCNVTHILGGLPQLEVTSIIAAIAIILGFWLGTKIIRFFTMIWKEE